MSLDQVRRFNRLVTERIGVLDDGYLHRGRPLGESRLLWEIGLQGAGVRELRHRLGLDSGYVSRMLRSLEAQGLVQVVPGQADRRVRVARLTTKGSREWRLLDRRSDELAEGLLAPLSLSQQERLVAAMAEVERLLTASSVDVRTVDAAGADAAYCLGEYFAELDRRMDTGFDPEVALPATAEEMSPPQGLFLVAYLRNRPVGCGGLKLHGSSPAEIKRMWVSSDSRGLGLGGRLLSELEARARELGATAVRLDTNETLIEAIAMYESNGYSRIPAFNEEPHATHWFEKQLASIKTTGIPLGAPAAARPGLSC
jgi:DNA-binding MarR family transcriptional regulator/N-acetylglutamate synthase-like GNAT family acetyltransferase